MTASEPNVLARFVRNISLIGDIIESWSIFAVVSIE